MKSSVFTDFLNDHFILFTSILSGALCALYVWKVLTKDFSPELGLLPL